ncbi:hypothetical protein D3C81_1882950 [compost metagenome]
MSALRVSRIGLPLSQVSVMASSSRFCSIRSAILSRTLERSCTEVRPQASAAAWAASRAFSMSSAVERGNSAIGWPFTGEVLVKYSPFTGGTNSPPM